MSAPDVVEWRRRIEKLPDTSRTWVIVSYLFPPAGGVGVQRALGFAKYLTQFGCRVSVVSASNPTHPARDQGLLRHVPASVRVLRAPTLEAPLWIKRLAQRWLAGAAGGQGIMALCGHSQS